MQLSHAACLQVLEGRLLSDLFYPAFPLSYTRHPFQDTLEAAAFAFVRAPESGTPPSLPGQELVNAILHDFLQHA